MADIIGTTGNDILNGTSDNDTIYGFAGDDIVTGGAGADQLDGGDGNDTLIVDSFDAVIQGGAGIDTLTVEGAGGVSLNILGASIEIVNGGSGDDSFTTFLNPPQPPPSINEYYLVRTIHGNDGNDVLHGVYADGDALYGDNGNDTLDGWLGADYLSGGAGDDRMIGWFDGNAADTLEGGAGDDVYEVDSADVIAESVNEGTDTVLVGSSYTLGENLENLTMIMWYATGDLTGNELNNVLTGNETANVLMGGMGTDTLIGGAGNDTYVFNSGDGADTIQDVSLTGEENRIRFGQGITAQSLSFVDEDGALRIDIGLNGDSIRLLNFSAANQTVVQTVEFSDGSTATLHDLMNNSGNLNLITGSPLNDYLYGTSQNDEIQGLGGNDQLYGLEGHDVLLGGAGNDFLQGDAGNDLLNGGAGNDSLQDWAGSDTYVFGVGSGVDTLQDWGWDVAEVDTVLVGQGVTPNSLFVTQDWATNPGGLTLRLAQSDDQLVIQHFNSIERIQFADGTVWDQATIQARTQQVQTGTEVNDFLSGFGLNNYLEGRGGDDTLYGNNGTDALLGGIGNDYLYGNAGSDVYNGGAGSDVLQDFSGSDTYVFGVGSGVDTVQDWGWDVTDVDTVLVTGGVTPENLLVTQDWATNPGGLTLRLAQSDDQLVIQHFNSIERIQFTDGTVWDQAAIQARTQYVQTGTAGTDYLGGGFQGDYLQGLGGDDQLWGGDGHDALLGGTGNDYLYGNAGNDVLNGGSGTDQLYGDMGSDTYVFGVGSGIDTVQDWGWDVVDVDTVLVGQGVTPNSLFVTQDWATNPGGLTLRLVQSDDQLVIQHFNSIERIQFADGTVWDQATIQARTQYVQTGTEGNDYLGGGFQGDYLQGLGGDDQLWGGDGHDALLGGTGNDYLYGNAGNDVFNGGSGNDQLVGDSGSDTYVFGVGSGTDTVQDWGWDVADVDTVLVGPGVTPVTLFVTQEWATNPGGITLRLRQGDDQLQIQGSNSIERIQFADGTVWDQAAIQLRLQQSLTGSAGDDFLWGSAESNYMQGLGGNDSLTGNDGNDVLLGGAGDDFLNGGQGDDVYDGGAGMDSLSDFSGSDTYRWGTGSGQDTVSDQDVGPGTIDRVEVQGATPSDVTITRDWGVNPNAITLWLNATGDALTLLDWFNPNGQIEEIRFADGTVWDQAAVLARLETTLTGTVGDDTLYGSELADTISGLEGNDSLHGQVGNDVLLGGAGDDYLDGGAGNDVYDGGAGMDYMNDFLGGSDTYRWGVESGQDSVGDLGWVPGEIDTVEVQGATPAEVTLTRELATNPMALTLHIAGTSDTLTLNQWFAADGQIEEIRFADGTVWDQAAVLARLETTLTGTAGDDTLYGSELADTISGLAGHDSLNGQAGNDILLGGAGDDFLNGGLGDDSYDGGVGVDNLMDFSGSDTYRWGMGSGQDTVSDQDVGPGTIDRVEVQGATPSDVTITRDWGVNPNAITLWLNATGDALTLLDWFNPNGQIEEIRFADGTVWDQAAVLARLETTLTGTAGDDTLYGSELADTISGLEGNDSLNGQAGNDVLDGGTGADQMFGGSGDDTFLVDNVADIVTEFAGGGNDQVYTSVNFSLAGDSEIETMILTGTDSIDATGSSTDNTIIGNSGGNTLDGGLGSDLLQGGAGHDTYVVDHAGDRVIENVDEGIDTVQSSITYSLGANVEHLVLTGDTAIQGTGNALDNMLTGNSAANVLSGGAGNDTYFVGAGDVVVEGADEGTDLIQSVGSFVLSDNVEHLTLTGAGAINGTGNSLNNILLGNVAANVLDGAAGADSMTGGQGDDTYVVDNVGDTVTEMASEGLDTVQSGITYALGANVENLTLTGTSTINGTGNGLDNVLTGNSAANVLTGEAGNDTYVIGAGDSIVEVAGGGTDTVQSALTYTLGSNLENLTLTGSSAVNGTGNSLANVLTGNSAANMLSGGTGNDTYVVGAGDTISESNNGGTDTVQSSVTWTLGANLENLMLTGSSAINGTGNSANNQLLGNAASNVLSGANGNDTVRGNAGNDTVNGGGGNDTYLFGRGEGQDLLQDSGGSADKILYDSGINPLDLVISRQANNLRLAIHGSTDYVTVQNWYTSSSNRTETIQAGDGKLLLSTQVDQLIQAMASFSQQTGLTWDQAIDQQPTQVQSILAASWQ